MFRIKTISSLFFHYFHFCWPEVDNMVILYISQCFPSILFLIYVVNIICEEFKSKNKQLINSLFSFIFAFSAGAHMVTLYINQCFSSVLFLNYATNIICWKLNTKTERRSIQTFFHFCVLQSSQFSRLVYQPVFSSILFLTYVTNISY